MHALSVEVAHKTKRSIIFKPRQTHQLTDIEYASVKSMLKQPVWNVVWKFDGFSTTTVDAIQEILEKQPRTTGSSDTTFNYVLDEAVTSEDIGKMMMLIRGGEGSIDRAAVYQEVEAKEAIFVLTLGSAGAAPAECNLNFHFYHADGTAISEDIVEGIDFNSSSDPQEQYTSIKNAFLARSNITDKFVIEDAESVYLGLKFTAKVTGGNPGIQYPYPSPSWINPTFDQYPNEGGSFNLPIGKLTAIEDNGYGVFAHYTGQTFTTISSLSKNDAIVATNNGFVRSYTGDNTEEYVVGLAKDSVEAGSLVSVNYCPSHPHIWQNSYENRIPTSVKDALDIYIKSRY